MSTFAEIKDPNVLNVSLLTNSFSKIEPQADEFAATFYQILFDRYPEVRPLFSETDMEKQKKKLIESLQLVIANVSRPEAFSSILKMLGKRHVAYGAVLTDYPLIGDALLQSLERYLGDDWNAEVEQTWSLAYQVIADTMAEGAKTVEPNPSARNNLSSQANQPGHFNFDSTEIDRLTSLKSAATSNKLILLGISAVVAISGYMMWNVMQSSTNSNQPSSVEQNR